MTPVARQKDRRQLNVAPPTGERRKGSNPDRRKCPDCGTALTKNSRRLAGGTVTVAECPKCGWSKSSRQTDADVLLLKMTWPLALEMHQGQLAAVLPQELTDALKLKQGDDLVLAPLTSPLGSLPMKWAVTVQRKKRK